VAASPASAFPGPLKLRAAIERWPLLKPFLITGYTWEAVEVLLVTLEAGGHIGSGEAAGVYYKDDKPAAMIRQVEALRGKIEAGVSRDFIRSALPPGGARNAIDCALWDLEAKTTGRPAWQIAGLAKPQPLLSTFTCGADRPEVMAETAQSYEDARAIKLKLTGEPMDADRVRAVREACPHVWLGVDGNQGLTRDSLEKLFPVLIQARVALLEQPFPIGHEALLDDLDSPIPVAADESCQSLADITGLVGRFRVVNIKLDKCGGLTEGLAMAKAARELGLDCMVGNMIGTSLAMAPPFLLGQSCQVVDLDGPIFLKSDREHPVRYVGGSIDCPPELWGA
jgi:L-alanine-DL-glutamate epimerase-like enolase superfamily enzyme